MGIVFFENFENDTAESISFRYPGTRRFLHGADMQGFPLMRSATGTSTANDGVFEFSGRMPVPERRLDLILYLNDNGNTTGQGNNAGQIVFYNNLRVYASSATVIRVDHSPYSGSGWFKEVPVPDVKSVREIYISIDYVAKTLLVIVDGDIVLNKEPVPTWNIIDTENNNLLVDALSAGIQNTWMPNFLQALVIATDLPDGQMFDTSTIKFQNVPLTIKDAGNAEYSDQGYTEDVDKADPYQTEPSVSQVGEGPFTYSLGEVEDRLSSKIYPAARSDQSMWVQVGGKEGSLDLLGMRQTVMLPIEPYEKEDIEISVTATQPWTSNGLGVEWGGEVDLIGYGELCDTLGFTNGTLMPEDSWLKFRLDGQEMYVAKKCIRHTVSWRQIYEAGLVYGTNDTGLFPVGTPTNQLRTVEIDGKDYLVRLLRGADEDPTPVPTGGGRDPEGTWRGEWARLFYPICEFSAGSYKGRKLASYAPEDLGVGTGGKMSLAQETNLNNDTLRLCVGNETWLDTMTFPSATATNVSYSWRPVLVPLPDHNAPLIAAGFYYDADKLFLEPNDLRGVYISDTDDL